MNQHCNGTHQRESMLARFALPGPVAARLAEDSRDHAVLASNKELPVEVAVTIAGTNRSASVLDSLLIRTRHPDVLRAVLGQRRVTSKTVLREALFVWNMDETTQQLFVDRALPADIADEYLRNRDWLPKPAAKAVARASWPVAAEYLAELAASSLDDETAAAAAAAVMDRTDKLQLDYKTQRCGEQHTVALRRLAEACWLRPAIKQAALESDTATAVAVLAQTGLTADETATVVAKLAENPNPALARHAAAQLLANPTVPAGTRQQIAQRHPAAALDAAAAGAHRPDTALSEGRLLRDVDNLDILDKAVAGTSAFTHLTDLIEHPATSRDPHILRRLLELPTEGPAKLKLAEHIIELRRRNELPETFTESVDGWQALERETDSGADGTDMPKETSRRYALNSGPSSRRSPREPGVTELAKLALGRIRYWDYRQLGNYWREQLGEGDTDQSAAAWQTALEMVRAVPEQSSADIIKLAKTLAASN